MYRKKILTCVTVLIMVLALAGIFYYMFCINNSEPKMDGTLVHAFSQKADEYCL